MGEDWLQSECRDDHGDVVAAARIERTLQQLLADVSRGLRVAERNRDHGIIDAVGEPIAAQHQTIAVFEVKQIHVDFDRAGGATERVGQDVTTLRKRRVAGR